MYRHIEGVPGKKLDNNLFSTTVTIILPGMIMSCHVIHDMSMMYHHTGVKVIATIISGLLKQLTLYTLGFRNVCDG